MDYEEQLDRAMEEKPDIAGNESRFEVPEPNVRKEGNVTVYENFQSTLDDLSRQQDHVLKFIQNELGTSAQIDDRGPRVSPVSSASAASRKCSTTTSRRTSSARSVACRTRTSRRTSKATSASTARRVAPGLPSDYCSRLRFSRSRSVRMNSASRRVA